MRLVSHSCGHDQEHYIIGEYAADYDKQAAKLSRGKCDACRTQAETLSGLQSRTTALELGLVALQGSPKQIAWAESIRMKRITAFRARDSDAVALVAQITDARWWIDRRSDTDENLVASAMRMQDC